jgi:group I intron endonuclease
MHIYKTTNLINNKIYIGQEKGNNLNYLGSGKLLQLAINKYGKENFKKEIIQECDNQEELNQAEIYWINNSDCLAPIGYNICHGNFGGDNFTNNPNKEDIRKKLKESAHGWIYCNWSGKTHTDESKEKISISKKGKISRCAGWKHTEETKEKLSKIRKGLTFIEIFGEEKTKLIKNKIIESNKGRIFNKPRPDMIGDKNPSKDINVKEKISDKKKENDNKIMCEYCKKEFTKPNYIKSHGKKCKLCEKN